MCCMSPVPAEATACPSCGYNGSQQNPEGLLPIGARVGKGKYLIGRAEEIHTECVDYIAFDVQNYKTVIVREFLPAGGITRAKGESDMQALEGAEKRFKRGLNRFASAYSQMKDLPEDCAIPSVRDLIQQNGTAYAVISRFSGMTLRELLRRNGGTLTVSQTEIVMDPVIDALEKVHGKGLYHGDLSLDNILINSNGDVRIEQFHVGDKPVTQKAVGFCSPECELGEKPRAESDVYSVAAIFYRCIMGTVPQDAKQRRNFDTLTPMQETDSTVPESVSNAVWNAMLVNVENRTPGVADFRNAVKGITGEEIPDFLADLYFSDEEKEAEEEEDKKTKNRWRYFASISAGLFLVMLLVFFVSKGIADKERARRREQERQEMPESLEIEVPDYRGKKVQDAELDTVSFDFVLISTFMDGKEAELVINQDPQPGTMVGKDERTITLFVNRTRDTTAIVPDLKDLYVPNAKHLLEQYGIQYEIRFVEKEGGLPGLVYEQSVEAGETIKLSDILKVYAQPDPTDPEMQEPQETEEPDSE